MHDDLRIFFLICARMGNPVEKFLAQNQDNPRKPLIARVDRFFEDTKKETDQKRVLVDWYLRLEDTSQMRNRDF